MMQHALRTGPASDAASHRRGISLLEVLVSCGILVVGLSSLAAVIPAAGSRLSQAAVEDRVGIAAANAYAEVVNRGLIASDLFTSGSRACVFGDVLRQTAGLSVVTGSSLAVANATVVNQRIDAQRGFALEDELVYSSGTAGAGINSSFLNGALGPREYRDNVCWGAMLAPFTNVASPGEFAGTSAVLSIAVFKKENPPQLISGTVAPFPGMTTLSGTTSNTLMQVGNATSADQIRKRFLPACSYILALPSADGLIKVPPVRPAWVRINSSWTAASGSFITLDYGSANANDYVTVSGANRSLSAVIFDGLMRVDRYPVRLD